MITSVQPNRNVVASELKLSQVLSLYREDNFFTSLAQSLLSVSLSACCKNEFEPADSISIAMKNEGGQKNGQKAKWNYVGCLPPFDSLLLNQIVGNGVGNQSIHC